MGLVFNWTGSASNINHVGQSACKIDTSLIRADRKASDITGFRHFAVQWLIEHFVLLIKCSAGTKYCAPKSAAS